MADAVRIAEGTVIWYGTDKPLTYGCRVCGKVIFKDVLGRPVFDVYPSPVLCSSDCNVRFINYLMAPLDQAKAPGEDEE